MKTSFLGGAHNHKEIEMPAASGDGFEGMVFATNRFGHGAIVTLKAFAPSSVHERLTAQLPRLVEIHDTGIMPHLGVVGEYLWLFAVWSNPSPLEISLMAWRADYRRMPITEALQLEKSDTSSRRLLGGTEGRQDTTLRHST